MSQITEPIMLDKTGEGILREMERQSAFLGMIAGNKYQEMIKDFKQIQMLVRQGLAPDVFKPGDQIIVPWTDKPTGTQYEVPMDIVHFGNVELQDGEIVPGMFLQWHFCSPFGVQFDGNEAFYYCEAELPAGAYNIKMGNGWGTHVVNGKTYTFTLTKPVPAGGQLQLGTATSETSALPDTAPANWRVRTYTSAATKDPIEIVTLTEGTSGTSLGTLSSSTKYAETGVNNMQRAAYGYNRWAQSGIRQYLNSKEAAGAWWKPQNVFDRAPGEHWTKDGFMAGFGEDFLSVLQPIRVRTALNTVSDSEIGTYEDTFDTFFLAGLEQQFIVPQIRGIEGEAWEYWRRASGRTTEIPTGVTGAAPLTYAINAKTSPQGVRLRSASRGTATYAWSVSSTGYVNYYYAGYAAHANRFAPACVIC